MSLAVIHLNGNLGHNAELRSTTTGTPVLNFSVACSSYLGSGDKRHEHVDWYRCALFGQRQAWDQMRAPARRAARSLFPE